MPRPILQSKRRLLALALCVGASLSRTPADEPPKKPDAEQRPPVQLTAREDHQRLMELLQIKALRPGANPNDPKAPNAVNYDESKANPYPELPAPLVLKNGTKVTTAEMWYAQRRQHSGGHTTGPNYPTFLKFADRYFKDMQPGNKL